MPPMMFGGMPPMYNPPGGAGYWDEVAVSYAAQAQMLMAAAQQAQSVATTMRVDPQLGMGYNMHDGAARKWSSGAAQKWSSVPYVDDPGGGVVAEADCTTLTVQNLPIGYDRAAMLRVLETEGFAKSYDFVYVPFNFRESAYFDYALVNMASPAAALRARDHFNGFKAWPCSSDTTCEAFFSKKNQGYITLVERYRNSPLMHNTVIDEQKPAVFHNGQRISFPEPTKTVRPLRFRNNPSAKQFGAKRTQLADRARVGEATANTS